MAIPNAAAIAMSTVQSTERRACSPVRQRVSSIRPGRGQRCDHQVHAAGDVHENHQEENHRSQPGAVMPRRSAVFDLGDQREVGVSLAGVGEVGVRFDQKHVAGLKPNVADFRLGHADALSMNGENRGVVDRSKAAQTDGLPDQRRMGANHGLDQSSVAPRRDLIDLIGVRDDALFAQVDHRIDDPGEVQSIAFAQDRRRRNRREHAACALDLVEVDAAQRTEPGLLDAVSDDRRALLHAHRDRVLARLAELLQRAPAILEQPLRGDDDEQHPDGKRRDAELRDVEDLELDGRVPLLGETGDDQVRARADQGAGAAENRRVRKRKSISETLK